MRDWFGKRPDLADGLLAAALVAAGIVSARSWPVRGESQAWLLRDLLVVAMFVPLAWRRRAPRTVLAFVSVAAVSNWMGGFLGVTTVIAGGLAFYGLGRYVDRPASLRSLFFFGGFVAVAAAVVALWSEGNPWYAVLGRCGLVMAAFAFGESQRSRSALLASLRAQADRAEALRAAEAQRAVVEERGRLARELHDVVAHSISVMVVQAVAAERLADRHPAAAVESMRNVAEVGRLALTEMRHIFDVLGPGERTIDLTPQPILGDLDAIFDRCRAGGMSIEVVRRGDSPSLSGGVELAIVRIVQEALTNTMRHAVGAQATVSLTFGTEVTIEVSDDGSLLPDRPESDGRGRGLIGMRQRVEALGGQLSTGWRTGGGFNVRAVLPIDPNQRHQDVVTGRSVT
jgi:signal transduction histidine kinase